MERTIISQFTDWKKGANRKPLIVNGARQVGKTWLLQEFARREYSKVAYLVCRKNEQLRAVFQQNFDMQRILRALRALTNVDITPHDTLVILDEVQDIPEAIEALKYFYEQLPDYHIAVAGSLLGVSLHQGVSFPVGKVDVIEVYPMNFNEFLLACGESEIEKLITANDFATLTMLHDKTVDLLRQYYYVGGMPEVVAEYVATGALQQVRHIQQTILHGYEMDFSKHAPKEQVQRIRLVWQTIPSQLFKDNKKFIYGAIKKGARAKEFEIALEWLANAGLVYKVPLVTKVALPLKIYEDLSAFKLYTHDVGLLGAMVDTTPEQVLLRNDFFSEFKSGMTEQYVLQELISHGNKNIYYHKTNDSRLEIDFVMQRNGKVLPMEVKAEDNVRANSLTSLLRNTPALNAVRYSMKPYREQEQMTCIPLYSIT